MANTRAGTVLRVDTSATFAEVRDIVAVKYIGAASGTAVIKNENTSGAQVWEEAGTSNVFNEVKISCSKGVRVEVTNSAVVYLYMK